MKIPFYNPPNEVQKICGLEHIGVDDVFKIIFDMPVGEEEAFQIVETLTDTDTAVDFFSKNEVKASNAREKIFRRVDLSKEGMIPRFRCRSLFCESYIV